MLLIDIEKFDENKRDMVEDRIADIKHTVSLNNDCEFKGRRYSDNKRMVYMICGVIAGELPNNSDGRYDYNTANDIFVKMDTYQLDRYIKKIVKESASADYYYMFEKDWG